MGGIAQNVAALQQGSAAPAPATTGLILYYNPANPVSYPGFGTTVNSVAAGTNLSGSMSNLTYTSPAFNFNGTSSQISVADNALLEPGTGDWTMEAWVNYSVVGLGTENIISKTDNGGTASAWSYGLRTVASGSTYMEIGNGTTSVTSPGYTVTTNTWYQIVGVWTNIAANTIELYVNGASQGSNSHAFTSVKNAGFPMYIGSYNGGEFSQWFNGKIGIVRIYNTALTSAEVLQNYNADRSFYGI